MVVVLPTECKTRWSFSAGQATHCVPALNHMQHTQSPRRRNAPPTLGVRPRQPQLPAAAPVAMADPNDLAKALAAALQPSMVAMVAAIAGALQPRLGPAARGPIGADAAPDADSTGDAVADAAAPDRKGVLRELRVSHFKPPLQLLYLLPERIVVLRLRSRRGQRLAQPGPRVGAAPAGFGAGHRWMVWSAPRSGRWLQRGAHLEWRRGQQPPNSAAAGAGSTTTTRTSTGTAACGRACARASYRRAPPMLRRAAMWALASSWAGIRGTSPVHYLMQQQPPEPMQTPEVRQTWSKLSVPPKHQTFIQTTLWKKIPVGLWLANWLPHSVPCPIDGKVEDVEHAMCGRRFLVPAFHIAQQCMGPVILDDLTKSDPQVILWDQPALSLQTPATCPLDGNHGKLEPAERC